MLYVYVYVSFPSRNPEALFFGRAAIFRMKIGGCGTTIGRVAKLILDFVTMCPLAEKARHVGILWNLEVDSKNFVGIKRMANLMGSNVYLWVELR